MKTRTSWAFILGGLGVVAGGSFLLRSARQHTATLESPPLALACQLRPDDQLEFKVHAVADTHTDGSTRSDAHQVLGATMKWQVLREDGAGGWLVAVLLGGVELDSASAQDAAYRAALQEPFLFRMGSDCHFRGLAFRPTTLPQAKVRLQALLQSLEIHLPATPMPAFWVAFQQDGLGRYTALYRHAGATLEGDAILSKERSQYLGLPGQGAVQARVLESQAELVLARDGRWLKTLQDRERITLSAGGALVADSRQQVQLERVAVRGPFPVGTDIDPDAFVFGDPIAEVRAEPPPPDPRLRGLPLSGVLDELATLLQKGDRSAHDIAEVLGQYLRLHPEKAIQLLAELRSGKYDDNVHAAAFLALEIAGTREAQAALLQAVREREMGMRDRMRAAVALPDVPSPSRDSVQGLIDLARHPRSTGDSDESIVSATALRALGALSRNVEGTQPELGQLARAAIRAELAGAKEADDITAALDAIGNSGDESLEGDIARFQQDDSSPVRSRAALAYRRMDPAVALPALSDWLAREKDGTVRQSIVDAILQVSQAAGWAPPPDSTVATAAAQLAQETDPQMRALLIQLLGTAVPRSPLARASLIAHYHRESSPPLLSLLGRYVGPEDINN